MRQLKTRFPLLTKAHFITTVTITNHHLIAKNSDTSKQSVTASKIRLKQTKNTFILLDRINVTNY